jgi:hypothetical protein
MASDTQAARGEKPAKKQSPLLCSGEFHLRFADESTARDAARTAGAAGFKSEVRDEKAAGWALVAARRNEPFPCDEQDRYSGRLRTIAAAHGGAFERFVQD